MEWSATPSDARNGQTVLYPVALMMRCTFSMRVPSVSVTVRRPDPTFGAAVSESQMSEVWNLTLP